MLVSTNSIYTFHFRFIDRIMSGDERLTESELCTFQSVDFSVNTTITTQQRAKKNKEKIHEQ